MAMRLAPCVKSTSAAEDDVFRKTRTSRQVIRNAALRRSHAFVASPSSFPTAEPPDEISRSAPRETASIAHMQCSCSVEHAQDGIPLSQNFAGGYRELSRSVSGMLHCIVRDKVDRLWLPSSHLPFSNTSISARLRKIASNPERHASLRQFATEMAWRDKVLRQLAARRFGSDSKTLQMRAVPPGTGRHLQSGSDATLLSGSHPARM